MVCCRQTMVCSHQTIEWGFLQQVFGTLKAQVLMVGDPSVRSVGGGGVVRLRKSPSL
ncbi:hypothetical protein [uncultured Alloprevotella sp.]|uniref:hypothetical protein n=1 Tax=uncultured Alloprevotella sp. TaxID=1283315 RepID=UPI00262C3AB7|nr:hypothetical protein [uncultured Alloprevotella sp.]